MPFEMLNAAAQSIEELRNARVDRESESKIAYTSLVKRSNNVLLYGPRGAGKTFLIRLLEDEISKAETSIFSCIVNVASLSLYDQGDEVAAFPRAVLLQLCTSMWTRVLGKSYLELRDSACDSGQELRLKNTAEKTIKSVYRHLIQQQLIQRTALTNTAGVSMVARGEKSEQSSFEVRHMQILPFEFAEFADQLIQDVLRPKGISKIVVFCDESNHTKLYKQEQLLERYLELFSSRRVQFLFVAGVGPWTKKEYLPTCFETTIELGGFRERSDVQALIDKAMSGSQGNVIPFASGAIDVVFETFAGHPRRTLNACQRAYCDARESNLAEIDVRSILRACREIERLEKEYEESVRGIWQRAG